MVEDNFSNYITNKRKESEMERRTFLKNSMVAGTATLGAGSLAFNVLKEADQAKKDQFTFSIVVGDSDINPALLAPGWDYAEIPNLLVVKPLSPKANWESTKSKIKSWNLPPLYAASHFFATNDQPEEGRIPFCGPDTDWDLAEFWTKRSYERMSELGIKCPGVYGDFFVIPDGYSKTKGMDQCLDLVPWLLTLRKSIICTLLLNLMAIHNP